MRDSEKALKNGFITPWEYLQRIRALSSKCPNENYQMKLDYEYQPTLLLFDNGIYIEVYVMLE